MPQTVSEVLLNEPNPVRRVTLVLEDIRPTLDMAQQIVAKLTDEYGRANCNRFEFLRSLGNTLR